MKNRPSPLLWGLAILILGAFFVLFLTNRSGGSAVPRPRRRLPAPAVTAAAAPAETEVEPASAAADGTEQAAAAGAVAAPRGKKTPPAAATLRPAPTATATKKPRATATSPPTRVVPKTSDGFPAITVDQLPPEALDTLALIASDGPFPFSKDGTTFQNREQLLPRKRGGYYREYTVITPGEGDRGARRIIAGAEGELYYTDDHYDSFSRIVEQ